MNPVHFTTNEKNHENKIYSTSATKNTFHWILPQRFNIIRMIDDSTLILISFKISLWLFGLNIEFMKF